MVPLTIMKVPLQNVVLTSKLKIKFIFFFQKKKKRLRQEDHHGLLCWVSLGHTVGTYLENQK